MSRAWADHDNRLPALAAAVALHAGIFALALWAPSRPPPPLFGASVPINLVSSGPPASAAPAQPAPQVQAAQTPAPTPQAPPQPAAPEVPLPAFTQPAQPTHAAPAGPVDLNRLQQMIQSAQHASGEKTSSARRGTVKAQTNPNVGAGAAQGPSASQLAGLEQLLERLWNPNCDVPGGDTVKLKVRFTVGLNGNLIGDPDAGGLEQSGGAVVSAAARRAVDAVRQAEPYAEPYYGQAITVNFDAKEACAKR